MTDKQANGHQKGMLVFRRAKNATEIVECYRLNGDAWRGKLSLEDYIGRETHIGAQAGTHKGSLSYWVLVDGKDKIVSACETLKRPAIRTKIKPDGTVGIVGVSCHTLSVVFTPSKYRGQGYAKEMLIRLNKELDEEVEHPGDFTTLYTEVGFTFYQSFGYEPVQNPDYDYLFTVNDDDDAFHSNDEDLKLLKDTGLQSIYSGLDLDQVLHDDLEMMKEYLKASTQKDGIVRVAVEPHTNTVRLLHARASYVHSKLKPSSTGPVKFGARAGDMYIVWMQDYDKGVLNVLRIGTTKGSSDNNNLKEVDALLVAAKQEARYWEFSKVVIWKSDAPKWMIDHLTEKRQGLRQERSSSQAMIRDYRGQHGPLLWEFCGKYAWF